MILLLHLVFFTPYPSLHTTIEQVFKERPDHDQFIYEIRPDSMNNPLNSLQADVVIARGFTAHALKCLDIPCAELKTSAYDVIVAIDQCIKNTSAKKIAIVGAFNMVYGADCMKVIYPDVTFQTYAINDETELDAAILQAVSDGNKAIVGGYSTVMLAEKYHIPCVMIESGREAINTAIEDAKNTALIALREKEKSNEISNIMNYSFQGIISTDRDGMITLANSFCYTVMCDIKTILIGKPLHLIFPDIPIQKVIQEGAKLLSQIHTHKNKSFLINCVPTYREQDITGCVLTFQSTSQIQAEEGKIRKKIHQSGFQAKYHFSDILHISAEMREVISAASDYSDADSNILIYGETGTGKELFAQSIHNASKRRNAPFVAINCSALPENLLESELFGYVEGAFTGASKGGKMGFFEIAHKGTIFLDEIGDISPNLQSRLLRVLQEREVIRLGNDVVIPIDVRVICATNKNLKDEVKAGNFRQDLLYRLDVLELNLPPLRKRKRDISLLIDNLLQFEHSRTGCCLRSISKEGKQLLTTYSWPGNIRELRNFCERICILCKKQTAYEEDVIKALPDLLVSPAKQENNLDKVPSNFLASAASSSERDEIVKALNMFHYNRSKTAEYLHINKSTLWRKMQKYQIDL